MKEEVTYGVVGVQELCEQGAGAGPSCSELGSFLLLLFSALGSVDTVSETLLHTAVERTSREAHKSLCIGEFPTTKTSIVPVVVVFPVIAGQSAGDELVIGTRPFPPPPIPLLPVNRT